jgi:spermidine synthase
VELVPSVKEAFGFYHADATECLQNPRGRIVIDDGRRFLKRTREKYDLIVIDPPPPVEAAGSSLLYSREFYEVAKEHLKPHGLVQAWFPSGETAIGQAVLRSVNDSFPYVRGFGSIDGWGIHFFASMEPIDVPTAEELVSRMPARARKDLLEWSTTGNLVTDVDYVLSRNLSLAKSLNRNPLVRITDDRPFNEYFLLRRWGL